MTKLLSTKVQAFWATWLLTWIAYFFNGLTEGTLIAIITLSFGIFATANVAQKMVYKDE